MQVWNLRFALWNDFQKIAEAMICEISFGIKILIKFQTLNYLFLNYIQNLLNFSYEKI